MILNHFTKNAGSWISSKKEKWNMNFVLKNKICHSIKGQIMLKYT